MKQLVYLDTNASTPIDPQVLELFFEVSKNHYGNPSSPHACGRAARNVIIEARKRLAASLGVDEAEIIFTSGGTEALNMLIRGVAEKKANGHIITSDLEHAAVLTTVKKLELKGWKASYLSPGLYGAPKPEDVEAALREDTCAIVLMAVNNETGVMTDVEAIGAIADKAGVPFIVDGVAWMGKGKVIIPKGVKGLCLSGHKFHAPKGIGAAFVAKDLKFSPQITGGSQEFTQRGGTENLAGIAALGMAASLIREDYAEQIRSLRDYFETGVRKFYPEVKVNGEGPRIGNTANLAFPAIDAETLMMQLDMEGVMVSAGSACASGSTEPSRVLVNMGIPYELAASSLRFSFSRLTTKDEVERALSILEKIIKSIISIQTSLK